MNTPEREPPSLNRGDLVEVDGLIGVVVGVDGDPNIPEDHVAAWFGDPKCRRISRGGTGGTQPELWIIPTEYLKPAAAPIYKH